MRLPFYLGSLFLFLVDRGGVPQLARRLFASFIIVLHWACFFLSFVGSILMLLVTIILSHFTQLLGLLLIKEVIFIQRQHCQTECPNEKTARRHFLIHFFIAEIEVPESVYCTFYPIF